MLGVNHISVKMCIHQALFSCYWVNLIRTSSTLFSSIWTYASRRAGRGAAPSPSRVSLALIQPLFLSSWGSRIAFCNVLSIWSGWPLCRCHWCKSSCGVLLTIQKPSFLFCCFSIIGKACFRRRGIDGEKRYMKNIVSIKVATGHPILPSSKIGSWLDEPSVRHGLHGLTHISHTDSKMELTPADPASKSTLTETSRETHENPFLWERLSLPFFGGCISFKEEQFLSNWYNN